MALSLTTANTVTVVDASQNINLQQSKTVIDTTAALNFVVETYNLAAAQATYQLVAQGDIAVLQDMCILVTSKTTATFAGVSVSLTAGAGAEILKVWDSFTLTGRMTALAVKNLDPTNPVTITVIVGGTNA
jgi:hypothetical protein